MKKVFIFLVIALLIVFGYLHYEGMNNPVVPPAQPATPIETPKPGTYTGADFSFTYDPQFTATGNASTTPWRVNTTSEGVLLAKVNIPDTFEPSTNFRGATFTVGRSDSVEGIRDCRIPTNGERMKGTKTIDGVTWNIITLTDAGAGNYYDTTSYRYLINGSCYALEYTIHSTNIGNYDPSQGIAEFDTQKVVSVLETMVDSFQFTK